MLYFFMYKTSPYVRTFLVHRICTRVCLLLDEESNVYSCMSAARLRRTWFGRTSPSCWPRCSCVSMTTAGLSATVSSRCVPTNTVVYNRVYLVCNFIATWLHVLVPNSYAVDPVSYEVCCCFSIVRRLWKFRALFSRGIKVSKQIPTAC